MDKETKAKIKGDSNPSYHFIRSMISRLIVSLDIDVDEVSPRWPPPLQNVDLSEATYEVASVPLSSIALVTNKTLKVTLPVHALCDCTADIKV